MMKTDRIGFVREGGAAHEKTGHFYHDDAHVWDGAPFHTSSRVPGINDFVFCTELYALPVNRGRAFILKSTVQEVSHGYGLWF